MAVRVVESTLDDAVTVFTQGDDYHIDEGLLTVTQGGKQIATFRRWDSVAIRPLEDPVIASARKTWVFEASA